MLKKHFLHRSLIANSQLNRIELVTRLGHHQNKSNDTSSVCSCSASSCQGSVASRRSRGREAPRLSLARSQSRLDDVLQGPPVRLTRPRDSSLGDGLSDGRTNQGSTLGSKVLVVSAVDRAGKVMNPVYSMMAVNFMN